MSKIYAERIHHFSYGHTVTNHEGKCKLLHGHNGTVHFTVEADKLDEIGRVLDFSVIKSRLCGWLEENWDHKFLVWINDPRFRPLSSIDITIVGVPFNPTAENMAQYLVEVIGPQELQGTGCRLVQVKFEETQKCCAIYKK